MEVFELSKKFSLMLFIYYIVVSVYLVGNIYCRVHDLELEDDDRKDFPLTTFGFLRGGALIVNMTKFSFKNPNNLDVTKNTFGFTIDMSASSGVSGYVEGMQEKCIFVESQDPEEVSKADSMVFFRMDLEKKKILIKRHGKLKNLTIIQETDQDKHSIKRRETDLMETQHDKMSDSYLLSGLRRKRENKTPTTPSKQEGTNKNTTKDSIHVPEKSDVDGNKDDKQDEQTNVTDSNTKPGNGVKTESETGKFLTTASQLLTELDLEKSIDDDGIVVYSTFFQVNIKTDAEVGLYNMYFHNCLQHEEPESGISLTVFLVEDNNGNYLSAGEMPLPTLFFCLSIVFFVIGCVWLTVLRRCKEDVYKIHYLMLVVVFVKSLSCLFHGVNSHFIQKEGIHEEAWAVLYYIVYLTKGALLFITILLIGAGWAFIKHIFSDKEKKLFLIVIPLQILDNIAWLIVEESEEGMSSYTIWKQVFILVDLLCCGAILFPVVWSIRHLQESSQTDGKAAISLNKLKLFRQFYILIVCYIYFTRIIVYLLKITVPFKYEWLDQLFRELATLIFFVVTGYKFRPAEDNPYLQVPQEEEDIEMDEVLTESGALDTVVRVNKTFNDGEANLVKVNSSKQQQENSHVYD